MSHGASQLQLPSRAEIPSVMQQSSHKSPMASSAPQQYSILPQPSQQCSMPTQGFQQYSMPSNSSQQYSTPSQALHQYSMAPQAPQQYSVPSEANKVPQHFSMSSQATVLPQQFSMPHEASRVSQQFRVPSEALQQHMVPTGDSTGSKNCSVPVNAPAEQFSMSETQAVKASMTQPQEIHASAGPEATPSAEGQSSIFVVPADKVGKLVRLVCNNDKIKTSIADATGCHITITPMEHWDEHKGATLLIEGPQAAIEAQLIANKLQ